jgi:hypothetical protein
MGSLTRIFIGYIDIFLTDDDCPILESDSEMDVLECHRYDPSSYIEHLTHHIHSFLIVTTTDIDKRSEEDITDFVAPDDSLLSLKAIFEQFSNYICVFSQCSDRTTHISWWEDTVFIAYSASRPSIISD